MKKSLLLILFLSFLISSYAQNEKFKALFIYNFTKYIEWPANKQVGEFVIGVFGNNPIEKELSVIAQKKSVGDQKILVKKLTSVPQCKSCNLVYIPETKSNSVKDIYTAVKGGGVVLVTDKKGYAKTFSGINFVNVGGKQQFEVNKKHIEDQGAAVNNTLVSLGIPVQ